MSFRTAQTDILALPSREWLGQVSRVVLTGIGLTLLVMSKTGNPTATNIRTSILDVLTPVLTAVSSPFEAASEFGAWMQGVVNMHSENIALKNQNIQLLQWQQAAKRLEAENESLRALLNAVPSKKKHFITVGLVSDFGGPYAQSALVNGGGEQGVKQDLAVINENGLIGRVIEVGKSSARVLLLGDINSRIPVVAERTRDRAMLSGNNTASPRLAYLASNSEVAVGDRIITSGDGGVFPAGIPVGVVTRVQNGEVTVQPFADISQVEFVSIVDYSF